MKAQHTPGPWTISKPMKFQDGYPHNLSVCLESPTRAVYVASIPGGVHYPEAQANACLIAAAPDLLAALQYWFDSKATTAELTARAKAAIAKATGETP